MQEARKDAGWKCEYRQLDAGRLRSGIVASEGDDVFLYTEADEKFATVKF